MPIERAPEKGREPRRQRHLGSAREQPLGLKEVQPSVAFPQKNQ